MHFVLLSQFLLVTLHGDRGGMTDRVGNYSCFSVPGYGILLPIEAECYMKGS